MYSLSRDEYKSEILKLYSDAYHLCAAGCGEIVLDGYWMRQGEWIRDVGNGESELRAKRVAEKLYEDLRKWALHILELEEEPAYTIPVVAVVFGFSRSTLLEFIKVEGPKCLSESTNEKMAGFIFAQFCRHDYGKLLERMIEDRKEFEKTSTLGSNMNGRKPLMKAGEYAPFNAYEGIEHLLE